MKKQLTGLLALLAGLTCLAGCLDDKKGDSSSNQGSDSSVVTPAYDLDAAKNAIYGKYPTKDEGRENYELPNSYEVDGVIYTLEWSTDATENVVLDRGAETTYVNVDTGLAADFEYNLVAQVSAPDGTSINVPFRRTLKAAPTAVLSPITAAPVAGQAYKLHMYQALKKNDLFFVGKMKDYYLATTNASNGETFEDGVDVYAVPVDGKEGVFNLQFTYEDKLQYIGLTNTYNNGSWHDNAILAESTVVAENANQTFEFTYNADYGTVVATLENVKSGKDADTTEGTTETFFLGTSNTYYTFGAMNVDEINNANTYVGKLVMMLDKANIAAEDKVAHTKQEIGVDSIFAGDNVVRLMDQGDRYPEASITWAITTDSTNFVLNGTKLTTTAVETTQNATLTATITCGDVTDTVSFEIKLVKVLNSAAEIVDAAYDLAKGEALPIAYELTGKITTVNKAYDSGFKNVTVTIAVEGKEDKPIECFRLKGEGADLIKVGDTITVSGILKNYDGKVEFDAGCALLSYVVGEEGGNEGGDEGVTNPELDETKAYSFFLTQVTNSKVLYLDGGVSTRYLTMTEDAAAAIEIYAEKAGAGYKFYTLVDGAKQYVNIYFNSESKVSVNYTADSTCVYSYNAESNCWYTNVNGTDYYLGTYSTYNTVSASKTSYINAENTGVEQFPLELILSDEIGSDDEGGNEGSEGSEGETPDVPEYASMTITEALAATVGTKVEISGTVSSLYEEWSSYGNMSPYITDGTATILVFRTTTKVAIGDVITVKGVIGAYNNVNQIAKDGLTVEITQVHTCDYAEATCKAPATCKFCGVAKDDVLGGHDYVEGVCSVCNGVDPDYEGEVVVSKSEELAIAATTGTLAADSSSISWTATNFTFVNEKAGSSSAIRTSDSDHFRVYKNNKTTISANNDVKITKIVITTTGSDYTNALMNATYSGATATADGNVVTFVLDGTTDSLVIEATSAQWRLKNIVVYYN